MKFIWPGFVLLLIHGTQALYLPNQIRFMSQEPMEKDTNIDLFKAPEVQAYLTQKVLEKVSLMMKHKKLKTQLDSQFAKLNRLMSG